MHGLINMQILDNSTTANQVVVFALYLLLIDFFQYWWHRAQHRFPVLWDQHVVHHSDEAMNVTTAVRHHWSEFLFQGIVVSLPFTMLFKITPPQAGFVALIFGAWQFFVHANLRLHLGFFAWLAAGPQVHRIHHSIEAEHRDKNFAAYFPIWDVLSALITTRGAGSIPRPASTDFGWKRLWRWRFTHSLLGRGGLDTRFVWPLIEQSRDCDASPHSLKQREHPVL
jgi:hypothetical protein